MTEFSLGTWFLIIFGIVLVVIFPLMAISNTQDDIAQVAVQSLVSEFVNKEATKGKVTATDFNELLAKLDATGNSYDVQLEHKIMTSNPNKGNKDQLGENLYYSVYNSDIIEGSRGIYANNEYTMKKGDYFICVVKNTNQTIGSQILSSIFPVGKNTYRIAASSTALVVNTGK